MQLKNGSIFEKQKTYWALALAGFISLFLIFLEPALRFDYDFEQFFPSDDPNLAFYQDHSSKFGSDNAYLLVALEHPQTGISDPEFWNQAFQIQEQIQDLDKIDTVISLLNLQKPLIGFFGISRSKVLNWRDSLSSQNTAEILLAYRSRLISQDGKSLLLLIQNQEKITKEEGDVLYNQIKKIFENQGIKPRAVAGKIQAQGDFVNLMQQEFGLFLSLSFLLMVGMLGMIFRTWWGIALPVFVLGLGVVWAIGWMLVLGKSLDVMSVMQPTLYLIVGLSAIIHFLSNFIKKIKEDIPKELAVKQVFGELWFPVFLTILTTSFGFLSLYFTSIPALKEFGLSTGLGVLVMFLVVILTLPGLLHLLPISRPKTELKWLGIPVLRSLLLFILRRRRLVLVVFSGLTLVSLLMASQLKINGYLLDNLPLEHPIQQDFAYFDTQYGGSNPLEISLQVGPAATSLLDYKVLEEIQKLEKEVQKQFGDGEIISPLTVVKLLNQGLNQGNEKAFRFPSLGQYLRIEKFLGNSSSQFTSDVLTEDKMAGRMYARAADLGSNLMGSKREALNVFVRSYIDPNYLKVQWTGTAYLIDRGHSSVSYQMAKGLSIAFLLVGIIAGFLFRSWRIALILLIPNFIPLIWMLGMMYLLGIDFKLTTAILFTVAFGIAVDDSIHFMTRLRMELATQKYFLYAIKRTFFEAGRAIIMTSVILISGFGLLAFSQFGVTHFTGVLISFSLIFALLADLFLLPILILPLRKLFQRRILK